MGGSHQHPTLVIVLNSLSALAGLAAEWCWVQSATGKLPTKLLSQDGEDGFNLMELLTRQAKWNARAATAAMIAAILQAWATFLS
jgi:hypothetical protein